MGDYTDLGIVLFVEAAVASVVIIISDQNRNQHQPGSVIAETVTGVENSMTEKIHLTYPKRVTQTEIVNSACA